MGLDNRINVETNGGVNIKNLISDQIDKSLKTLSVVLLVP